MSHRIPRFFRVIEGGLRARAEVLPWQIFSLRYGLPEVALAEIADPTLPIAEPILDQACVPPFIPDLDHDDFTPLMRIARSVKPRVMLELGTAYGNLTANLARNCPDARIYTVNAPLDEQTGVLTTFELARGEVGQVYNKHGYADRIVQIFCNTLSLDLSQYFDSPVIDLAIIDACHDADYVMNDFHRVRPYVRPSGIVLFHDTHPSMRRHLRGSYVACMKLRRDHFDVRHLSGTWWAIWKSRWPRPSNGHAPTSLRTRAPSSAP